MLTLGISCYYHDAAAVLVKNGEVISASLEERFSRNKHDSAFPLQAIHFCLKDNSLKPEDLDFIVFYEKPFLKFERIYQSVLNYTPKSYGLFREATFSTFGEKLWIRSMIENKLNINSKKILFVPHHLSHAASTFLTSPFPKAAILTIDGVGEWSTASIGTGDDQGITIAKEMRFPASLGLLYSVFTAFLGFEVNEGEYKVMCMAGYGKPTLKNKIYQTFKLFDDGSLVPNLSYFSYHYHNRRSFNSNFIKLFGAPRIPKSPFDINSPKDRYYADVAASIQEVTEEIVIMMARYVHRTTDLKNLCLAGGVALNGLANYRLFKEKIFDNIHIQPAAGDSGGAMGAALYIDYCFGSKKRNTLNNVYLGQDYTQSEINSYLNQNNIPSKRFSDNELFKYISDKISNGKIIGWFNGKGEWGPRALGHRSILADPRNPRMKSLVNEKIKFREPFRPFAPSVLAEHASAFFDISPTTHSPQPITPFDFMLYVVKVKSEKRKLIPAVTHVDGTSRPQLVYKQISPRYWGLINAFYKKTGVPMLLNTSFNLSTEPIVNSLADAYKTFQESGLDILVLGNNIILK